MSRWRNQDSAILEAVAAAERRHVQTLTTIAVAAELSITEQDVWTGLQALRDAEYITWGQLLSGGQGKHTITSPRLLERGLRATGEWPEDSYGVLISVLEARIEATLEPDLRSRLERLRMGLLDVGREVGVDLTKAFARGLVGLS